MPDAFAVMSSDGMRAVVFTFVAGRAVVRWRQAKAARRATEQFFWAVALNGVLLVVGIALLLALHLLSHTRAVSITLAISLLMFVLPYTILEFKTLFGSTKKFSPQKAAQSNQTPVVTEESQQIAADTLPQGDLPCASPVLLSTKR